MLTINFFKAQQTNNKRK